MLGLRLSSSRRIKPAVVTLFFLLLPAFALAEKVEFITYHSGPPFIVDEETQLGLTYDLAEFLSKNSKGRYQFSVSLWPRARLNDLLKSGKEAVVPWTRPIWFRDPQKEHFLWTEGFFPGSNAIVSYTDNPIDYEGPESLIGTSMVGLQGGRWAELELWVEQGKINRINTSNYLSALNMVARHRVDATLVPLLVARYLMANENSLRDTLFISTISSSTYHRHFLINGRKDIRDYLQTQVPVLLDSGIMEIWLKRYGL